MRSPPILPALHDMPHTLSADNQVINGNNTSFCEDLSKLEGFGYANKETLGGLLYAFFRRFAIEFDYDHHVISMRHGRYLTKESKDWHIPGKHYKLFCVEEPLDTSRNLGNSSDMASSKGLKQEFGRALDILIHRGSLNECCEQWVFPPIFYNNNFRNGENSGYHHTHHAAGRRYTLGYRQNNNHNNYNQYKDQPDIDDNDEEEGEHYANDRSYATFRSMVTTTSTGQNGGYRTNRSNSAPRLDVSAFSAYRNSAKQPAVPFSGTNPATNKPSTLRYPPSKNGMASSFSGSSFLDQDPFGVTNPSSSSTPSRNRSKSVSAVENDIVAIRPPIKQEKSNSAANGPNVSGSGTGAPRQRRSKSSNRGDGSKHVGNSNYNNNGANHQNQNHQSQQHQHHQNQHHNHNNSTNGGNSSGNNGNSGNSGSNANKQGRSNHNHNHNHNSNAPTNGSGRSPRSTVEFNLADIAPKALMSSANLASKDSESQKAGSDGKKGGNKRNVVWSTNSNRGESRGTHSGSGNSSNHAQKGPQSETEKKAKATKALAEHIEQAGPREASA
ncbi:hypothetical protein BG000_005658 [Podila horticola]|nr:hypothetical protein BG000_005658 [Podila horticola]